jgi:arabinofuranosyltransferase
LNSQEDRSDLVRFTIVLASFLAYAALFVYRTSFVVNGARYFSLFDDAMISMRYASHLAGGQGLVWNAGMSPVEGYTNPLWVLYMAGIHLLPIAPSKVSLVVQITAAVCLAVNLYFVRQISLSISDRSPSIALAAVALTALYLPINNWSLQGMEVSVLVMTVTICLWLILRYLDTGAGLPVLYLLLGLSTWVRPDMAVTFAGMLIFMLAADRGNWRRHVSIGLSVLVLSVAIQTALRIAYFGDPLPNTYYLKMTGYPTVLRLSRGLYVLVAFVWKANPVVFAVATLAALRKRPRTSLLLWVLVAQMSYSVYVGGDAWEYWGGSNRYIAVAMPGFFILLADGLFRLTRQTIATINRSRSTTLPEKSFLMTGVFSALVVFSVLSVNSIHGVGALAELFLLKPALHAGPGDENQRDVEAALVLRDITEPSATVALTRAGTIPYFSDRATIDLLGKTDKVVARERSRVSAGALRFIDFRPGHTKFDYEYSIGRQRPDVIVQLWDHLEEVQPYLDAYYRRIRVGGQCLYVRLDSDKLRSQPLSAAGCS